MNKLIILDFDGTIYKGDSMRDFAKSINLVKYFFSLGIVFFPFLLSKIGLVDRSSLKQIFIKINFKGLNKKELSIFNLSFFEKNKHRIYPKALAYIKNNQKAKIIIVTGSCNEWLAPFAHYLNVELISTQLSYNQDVLSGSILGLNNIGDTKVANIKKQLQLSDYGEIISFGDSKSDLKLKKISTNYHHNYFRD